MTPRERLQAAVDGAPVDRVPFTAWHHFHLNPPAGPNSDMADAELKFYDSFRPDLFKVMHDIGYEEIDELRDAGDWRAIPVLDPKSGNFGKQLDTLRQIRTILDPSVPMIDTVFGVYHYANEISSGKLLSHLEENPDAVHTGLAAIAQSLRLYARATIEVGCEGIYYALSGASGEGASRDVYATSFKALDRAVLTAVAGAPFNVLHLHGYTDLYFDLVHDLPASIVCWSDRSTGPSITEARRIHSGCLMAGLDETRFGKMAPHQISAQARAAIAEAGSLKFILAPGCSVPDNVSVDRLVAIRKAAC